MHPTSISPAQASLALRAMKTVAQADDRFGDNERALIAQSARAMGVECDLDALRELSPEEAARALPEDLWRTRLLQAMLVMAMIDGEVSPNELSLLKRFAQGMDVDEPRLMNLEQFLRGHFTMIQFDLSRRSEMIDEAARSAWRHGGLKGMKHYFGAFVGLGEDPELAWRYKKLGLLPEGTLGREYWRHCVSRGFNFPGEPGMTLPREFVKHDLAHVISGYDTDAAGEVEVIAFVAGFMKTDPFWYVFSIIMHMHLGVRVFGLDPIAHGAADPARLIAALERGMTVNRDLYDPDLDWWPHFPKPLEEVRREFGMDPEGVNLS